MKRVAPLLGPANATAAATATARPAVRPRLADLDGHTVCDTVVGYHAKATSTYVGLRHHHGKLFLHRADRRPEALAKGTLIAAQVRLKCYCRSIRVLCPPDRRGGGGAASSSSSSPPLEAAPGHTLAVLLGVETTPQSVYIRLGPFHPGGTDAEFAASPPSTSTPLPPPTLPVYLQGRDKQSVRTGCGPFAVGAVVEVAVALWPFAHQLRCGDAAATALL